MGEMRILGGLGPLPPPEYATGRTDGILKIYLVDCNAHRSPMESLLFLENF
mgnify:CR=1 FL=1